MADRKKPYDRLSGVPYGTVPKVLLVGNGINLSFPGATEIDGIVKEEWKKHYSTPLPDRPKNGDKTEECHELWKLSFPLQVVAATKDHVQSCMSGLAESFREMDVSPDQRAFITSIYNSDLDAVLSTNYSLEFEKTLFPGYSERKLYSRYRTTQEQTDQQRQFGIYQCTELPNEKRTTLWHIHGTALRKNSLIMGQLYYGRLLSEIIARSNTVFEQYQLSQQKKSDYYPMSWIDYFLIGEVHIMGFGMDFSETDIWWLLSKKKSAFPETKVFFYEPGAIQPEKALMLNCYEVSTPQVFFDKNEEMRFVEYYKRVVDRLS